MFVGTVNVCLDQCQKVPCGNGIYGLGKRRKRRSVLTADPPKDPNKVFEIEMMAYLRIGYTPEEMAKRQGSIQASYIQEKSEQISSVPVAANRKLSDDKPSSIPMLGQYESLTSSSFVLNAQSFLTIFVTICSVLSLFV